MDRVRRGNAGLVVVCALGIASAFAGQIVHASQASTEPQVPVNPPMDAQTMRDWTTGFAAQFTQLTPTASAVDLSSATAAAETRYPGMVARKYAPGVVLAAARFGRLTLPNYYTILPDGTREYPIRDHLAWILSFLHANVPFEGPPPLGQHVLTNLPRFDSEANVVVDASSGTVLYTFAISRSLG